jgi:hypothetical protein
MCGTEYTNQAISGTDGYVTSFLYPSYPVARIITLLIPLKVPFTPFRGIGGYAAKQLFLKRLNITQISKVVDHYL